MAVLGGNTNPIHIIQASDLVENGGDYKITGRVAHRVYGDDDRLAEGGTLTNIYILQDSDLVENGGNFKVIGNNAIPLSKLRTAPPDENIGRVVIPVYLENTNWIEEVVFYDTFTDVNGTTLLTHPPDIGNPWTNGGGVYARTFEVDNNEAQIQLNGSTHGNVADSTIADKNFTFDITTTSVVSAGRIALFTWKWAAGLLYWGILTNGVGDVQLRQGTIVRASAIGLLAPSTNYNITGSVVGNTHTFTINGQTLSYTDPTSFLLAETRISILANDQEYKFDNIRITTV